MSKTFVIGDIHGCYTELIQLIRQAGIKENDLILSLGDIVDRGNASPEVYHFLKERPNTVVLMGNHERKHLNGILSYAQEIVKLQFGSEYPEFLQWLQSLGYSYETAEAIIVHAAFEDGVPLHQQREDVLCGSTAGDRYLSKYYPENTYWNDHYTDEKPVIFGHHVVGDSPEVKNNTYGIDTGACHGGFLTAIELPGFIVHQVKAVKDYWKEEQAYWQLPVLRAKDWLNMEPALIRKQIAKLRYIEAHEVQTFLSGLENWINRLEELFPELLTALNAFTRQLLSQNADTFSEVANSYPFRTFLFKSRSGKLKTDDLKKSLDTPLKIIELARELDLPQIPQWPDNTKTV